MTNEACLAIAAQPSQAQIARALQLSGAAVTKMKRQGMPVYSVEAAAEWRGKNVRAYIRAADKPTPKADYRRYRVAVMGAVCVGLAPLRVFRDVDENGKLTRSFLRRREAHWRRFPLHDSHVRAYLAATTPTSRQMWTCPQCSSVLRFLDRPRGAGGKLKKHCGCASGVSRRKVSPEHRALHDRISRELWCAMRGLKAGRKWRELLGYTVEDLSLHLERMLPHGYTLAR